MLENKFRYLALGLLIVLGMYMIVSMAGAAETVITGTKERAGIEKQEDGEFGVFVPLTEKEIEGLREKGITIEELFYLDFREEAGSTIRIFKNRMDINRIDLDAGRLAQKENEIVLEKRYCEEHKLGIGNNIVIADNSYEIVGIGSVPDYSAVYKNLSDSTIDSEQFGIGFVDEKVYDALKATGESEKTEEYQYAYQLNGEMTNGELRKKLEKMTFIAGEAEDPYFQDYWEKTGGKKEALSDGVNKWMEKYLDEDLSNLTFFLAAENNPRIDAAAEDQIVNKFSALVAGVIIMILFTYVISVFVIHGIEKESTVIGALYALGAKKGDLLCRCRIVTATIRFRYLRRSIRHICLYIVWLCRRSQHFLSIIL